MYVLDNNENTCMLAYQIRGRRKRALKGVTSPVRGQIAAVLKSDGEEVPTCVYNELVAARLGALIGIPAAQGVAAQGDLAYEYASLLAATPAGRLPPVTATRAAAVALRYPRESAATLVFDVFIGNWDRAGNIKAAVASPVSFFCAFDHSHCLLALDDTPQESIERLATDDPGLTGHLFLGLVDEKLIRPWVSRIEALAPESIEAACCLGTPVNMVGTGMQRRLARALVERQKHLATMVARLVAREEGR